MLQNFDGIAADGVAPPNATGKAGATQFVQWVNYKYAIYDKNSGRQLQAPRPGNCGSGNQASVAPVASA